MSKNILICICENDDHGNRSGKAVKVTVHVAGDLPISFEAKNMLEMDENENFIGGATCFTDSGRVVEIHGNRFKFNTSQDWVGNMHWNGYHFPPDYGLGLINMLIRSNEWDIEQAWEDIINKIGRGELITGTDLELDEDYQPLALNPNQLNIPYFNQPTINSAHGYTEGSELQ